MSRRDPDIGSVGRFVAQARNTPFLSREEELRLALRYRDHEDPQAANQIVRSHLRMAIKLAGKYRGYGLPIEDLIQEANIGLLQAVRGFEPDRGFRFSTYAGWWMRAAIQDYVIRTLSIVRLSMTTEGKLTFYRLNKVKQIVGVDYEGDLRPDHLEKIAYLLGVPKQTVAYAHLRSRPDMSLNAKVEDNHGTETLEWVDTLRDEAPDQETKLIEKQELGNRLKAMGAAFSILDPRERDILERRRLREPSLSLQELADEYGLSRERIRQLEKRAFEKVQKRMGLAKSFARHRTYQRRKAPVRELEPA